MPLRALLPTLRVVRFAGRLAGRLPESLLPTATKLRREGYPWELRGMGPVSPDEETSMEVRAVRLQVQIQAQWKSPRQIQHKCS